MIKLWTHNREWHIIAQTIGRAMGLFTVSFGMEDKNVIAKSAAFFGSENLQKSATSKFID